MCMIEFIFNLYHKDILYYILQPRLLILAFKVGALRIMSSDAQLVVISIPSAKNDLVVGLVATHDLVGELVGVLANRYNM